jgi:hypothetical protein
MWATIAGELHLLYYEDVYWWRDAHRPRPENVRLYRKGDFPHQRFNVAVGFNDDSHMDKLAYAQCPKICSLAVTYFDAGNPKNIDARPSDRTIQKLKSWNTVFCGHTQKKRWGLEGTDKPVIYYGLGPAKWDDPGPRDNGKICVVAHDFRYRDNVLDFNWCARLLDGLPWDVIGRQRDRLPAIYPESVGGLKNIYRSYSVFFDPAHTSPLSFALIEAMFMGMAIVTRPHDDVPYFLTDGKNAVVSDDDSALRAACERLTHDKRERDRLGEAARKTALKYFTLERWQKETLAYLRHIGVRGI